MPVMGAPPTFYRDVLPILQNRCQECHRAGEMAPMPLVTYRETRPWAKAIREATRTRKMPPWFADPCCGKFSNDRSLTAAEIETLGAWASTGAAEGDAKDAPKAREWAAGWNLGVRIRWWRCRARSTCRRRGRWSISISRLRRGFKKTAGFKGWRRGRAIARWCITWWCTFASRDRRGREGRPKSDILTVWAPGSSPDVWPQGMAKRVKAGSDLVFEIHYTPNGKRTTDRTSVGLVFAKSPPEKAVLTLQMDNERFVIPPGEREYRVTVWGTLPNDALLLGFFPHMHLRGKAFEYTRIRDNGQPETLLKVGRYDFYWQLSYHLAAPLELKKGTRLEWVAWFDNSANNPRNPDPAAEVRYGQQSWEEMMIGFFDVAVPAEMGKADYFVR